VSSFGMILALGATALTMSGSAIAATSPNDVLVVQAVQRSALGDDAIVVSYRDLAIGTAAGQRALLRRVSFAIDAACLPSGLSSNDPLFSMKCTNSAWESARPQISQLFPGR